MRKTVTISVSNYPNIKDQLVQWGQQYEDCYYLDSNQHTDQNSSFDALLAVGTESRLIAQEVHGFNALHNFFEAEKDWLFGYLGYDLKNGLENLTSTGIDDLEFPALYFFRPKKLFSLKDELLTISYLEGVYEEIETDFNEITTIKCVVPNSNLNATVKSRMSKELYIEKAQKLLDHIHRGDIYEVNFCQEFYVENIRFNPLELFRILNKKLEAPFASFLKMDDKYVISASPERFIKRNNTKIISQPIKGTAKRNLENIEEDAQLKKELEVHPKERAENIMIVDLVRNDLSKIADKGSVQVTELCKVYPYKQVHQMVSTIEATVAKSVTPVSILKATFPMGSMTGAPKFAAMTLIEKYELTKRGLYSGGIGYIDPNGNFDFSVVIRTILYNVENKFLSFSVGSALTAMALPEKEYEECLLKAQALIEVLEQAN